MKVNDSTKTRADILEAALQEFALHSFDRADLRTISARANLAHGNIRYHFKTKEKLWFAAVEYLFVRYNNEIGVTDIEHRLLLRGDRKTFRAWLRRYVHYCAEHPEHARIILLESIAPSTRLEIAVERFMKPGHQLARRYVTALKKQGVFPGRAPIASLVYIITGACQNIFALNAECKMTQGYNCMSARAIKAHADTVVDLICPL